METQTIDPNIPALLRWTDYLTQRSCTLRLLAADASLPLKTLVSLYLEHVDTEALVSDGRLLSDDAPAFESMRDLALVLSDDGATGGIIPATIFRAGVRQLSLHERPPARAAVIGETKVTLTDILIDRSEIDCSRNWRGFDFRRRRRMQRSIEEYIDSALRASNPADADQLRKLVSPSDKIEFLRRVAKSIWNSPFENYSRFTGDKIPYKTGDEALLNMIRGEGAICSEKVQALKFITDGYGFESRYVFAGADSPAPAPIDDLRRIIDTFEFEGEQNTMRYWQHMALEFVLDDNETVLVDATNGNIPFLFLRGSEGDAVLNGPPIRVRMGTYAEDFYYHRVPDDLAQDVFFSMENSIPEIDLVQVFDNELGLIITRDFLIAPVPYRNEAEFDDLREVYRDLARPLELRHEVHPEWELSGSQGAAFAEQEPAAAARIIESRGHLLRRYQLFEGDDHDMGLAVVRLRPEK